MAGSTVRTTRAVGRERQPGHIRRKRSTPAHVDEHRGKDSETSRRVDICSLLDHLQSRSRSRALTCQSVTAPTTAEREAGRRAAAAEPLGSDTAARYRGRSFYLLSWFQAAVAARMDLQPICMQTLAASFSRPLLDHELQSLSRRAFLPLLLPSRSKLNE